MDTLLAHSINNFMLMFIPELFLKTFPTIVTAFLVTVIPYTPMDIIAFLVIFLCIYITDFFGMASVDAPYCHYNKLETKRVPSVWAALKNTYYFYFVFMMIMNFYNVNTHKNSVIPAGVLSGRQIEVPASTAVKVAAPKIKPPRPPAPAARTAPPRPPAPVRAVASK